MLILARSLTYAALFIGGVLVLLPAQITQWTGVTLPRPGGATALVGETLATLGGALALWCIVTFALIGKGTPAPFDPPRRLVVRGPYGFVRNPMYWGAGLVLFGVALVYRSRPLALYALLYFGTLHLLVVWYEEPTLRRLFGADYQAYCLRVRRWWPLRRRA